MYYYINGTCTHYTADLAVIDVGGIGYACHTTLSTLGHLTVGQPAQLYTYLHVKEDAMDLFGFHTPEEKAFFLRLIGISGVGPRSALSILSVATPDQLAMAIMSDNAKVLTQAAGVGIKLAQRIILELKDKIAKQQLDFPAQQFGASPATPDGLRNLRDAQAALMVLGYTAAEAARAIDGLNSEEKVETLVSQALKRMG